MTHRIYISVLAAVLCLGITRGETLTNVIVQHRTSPSDIVTLPFEAPTVKQWRYNTSLTSIVGSLTDQSGDNSCLRPRKSSFDLAATTYTKYKTSTLWGHGSYANSKIHNVRWCETADADLVYPYVLADSVGGNMNSEVYDFGAGYADHSDRWAWGGTLSYIARLEYRNVDPRPRNVSGTLDLAVSALYRAYNDYWTGISLSWQRYKQSNDIDFKSEMGIDKIFHLTGLGNHYNRFAGTGLSTSYDGYRYGLSLLAWPSTNNGGFLSAKLSRFTFRNLLVDLNKLPMARVWHNTFEAQAGYMDATWVVLTDVELYRRHGIENVFSDAQSGQYPLIASNTMYADNSVRLGVTGRWRSALSIDASRPIFTLTTHTGWIHRTEAYVLPYSYTERSAVDFEINARFDRQLGKKWLIGSELGLGGIFPYHYSLSLDQSDAEVESLLSLTRAKFEYNTKRRILSHGQLSIARHLMDRYTIQIDGSVRYVASDYHAADRCEYTIALSLLF